MRNFYRFLIWVGIATMTSVAQADDGSNAATVARGPAPVWAVVNGPLEVPADATGLAFVRQNATVVYLDSEGQRTFVAQRLRLLQPQALQLGNFSISWNPAAGEPMLHMLRVHRDGQTIDLTDSAKFEILRREDQLEEAMISGVLTGIYKVPDLRVGDDLEFHFSLPSNDPTLRDHSSGLLALGGTNLPGRYELVLAWEPGQETNVRSTEDFGAALQRLPAGVRLSVDNPPLQTAPKSAPPRFNWQRVIEYSDFASWQDLSKRFAPLYAKAGSLTPNSPLKHEAARIAAAHSDPLERAQAVLKLVQDQVRYIYVGLNGGNLEPASAGRLGSAATATARGRRFCCLPCSMSSVSLRNRC